MFCVCEEKTHTEFVNPFPPPSLTSWQMSCVESCLLSRLSTASRECLHTPAQGLFLGLWITPLFHQHCMERATSDSVIGCIHGRH